MRFSEFTSLQVARSRACSPCTISARDGPSFGTLVSTGGFRRSKYIFFVYHRRSPILFCQQLTGQSVVSTDPHRSQAEGSSVRREAGGVFGLSSRAVLSKFPRSIEAIGAFRSLFGVILQPMTFAWVYRQREHLPSLLMWGQLLTGCLSNRHRGQRRLLLTSFISFPASLARIRDIQEWSWCYATLESRALCGGDLHCSV